MEYKIEKGEIRMPISELNRLNEEAKNLSFLENMVFNERTGIQEMIEHGFRKMSVVGFIMWKMKMKSLNK